MTYTINLDYAQQDTQSQLYPAFQADNYQPKLRDKVSICLNEESVGTLSGNAVTLLDLTVLEAEFKSGITNVFGIRGDLRVMPLAMPQSFCFHKETSRYGRIEAGKKFKENGLVSAAKIHFCAAVGNELIIDDEGNPQVFTLNLKSSKTQLIKGTKATKGDGSLFGWNEQIKADHKAKGWLLHMFGFKLTAKPQQFTSSVTGDSSVGIVFELSDPQPIAPQHQKAIFDKLQDETLKENIKNPYKLPAIGETQATESVAAEYDPADVNFDIF